MAAWSEGGRDRTLKTLWYRMVKRKTIKRSIMAQRGKQIVVNPPDDDAIEVPVHRIAEYIPASFIAVDDGVEDALNDPESRIYRVKDGGMSLVYNQGVLTFDCTALRLVLDKLEDMSETDLAEVLDLVED
jgi:hypothetical protein